MRLRRRLLAVSAGAAALLPAPAAAHVFLVRSEPADTASVSSVPHEARLFFSEELRPSYTRVELRRLDGRPVRIVSVRVSGREVTASLPAGLPHGTYTVGWRVMSVEDGHLGQGSVVFGAGARVAAVDRPGEPAPPPPEVVLRWLNLSLVAVLVGAFAVVFLVLPVASSDRMRRRALTTAAGAAALALPVGLGLLAWQTSRLAKAATGSLPELAAGLLASHWGAVWLGRELLIACLLALAVALLRRTSRTRRAGAVAAALALALVLAQALGGHANGLPTGRGLAVLVDGAHLLASSVWVGGLVTLVIALRGGARPTVLACWRRFGVLAASAVAVVVVSGLYLAGRQVASLDALVGTIFGLALLTKTALLAAAGVFGLAGAVAVHRRTAAPRLALAEGSILLALVGVVGVLTAAVPARGPTFSASSPVSAFTRSAGDLLVAVSIKPNRPGENVYDVRAVSTRRPSPARITRVRLAFTAAGGRTLETAPLRSSGGGRYRLGGAELARTGTWQVAAIVERAGLPTARVTSAWTVASATSPRRVVLSDRPLRPLLTRAAAGAALVLLLAICIGIARRRLRGQRLPARTRREGSVL